MPAPIDPDTILELLRVPRIALSDTKQGWLNMTWDLYHEDDVVETFKATVEVSNLISKIALKMYLAGARDAVQMHNRLLGHGAEK